MYHLLSHCAIMIAADTPTHKVYSDAMEVNTPEEAHNYLWEIIPWIQACEPTTTTAVARDVALKNIGYWTGQQTRDRARLICELYATEHPVFGKWERDYTLSQVLHAGMLVGETVKLGGTNEEAIARAKKYLQELPL
jgi:hypothetical protein